MSTSPVQSADLMLILPELVLAGFAILIMVTDPFLRPSRRKWLGIVALVGTGAAAAATVLMAGQTGTAFGGMILGDAFSVYFRFLLLAIAALTLLSSLGYVEREGFPPGEFYALILFGTVGMGLMVASAELIVVFLGLEMSSISTYILAGYRRQDSLSNEASLKYFLLGSFATAFFLYGIAFVYGLTGTTNLTILADRLQTPLGATRLALVAMILMFVGLAFKVSCVPFQVWTPDVYEGAPTPVTAFLSAGPKAAAFAVFLRIALAVFEPTGETGFWILWISAALTMTFGNFAALVQTNIKRLLAYSSIAHAGYILVGFASGTPEGRAAVMFYLVAYSLMNLGAFAVVAHLAGKGDRWVRLEDFTGLSRERPALAACLAIFMLSLTGIPLTAGFFGKFYLFSAAVNSGLIGLTILGMLNSAVSVYYYLRVVVMMYMREGPRPAPTESIPWALGAALALSVLGTLYLGILPGWFLSKTVAAIPLP
ncbi:MAG: NADH-quinone oxidoreductase subunit N [Acidobacteria bacterium]|nr:NADH-quinone oxidoreductase subunit N [Acidobacteriota bacterium]